MPSTATNNAMTKTGSVHAEPGRENDRAQREESHVEQDDPSQQRPER
jgi:hypothetical protein